MCKRLKKAEKAFNEAISECLHVHASLRGSREKLTQVIQNSKRAEKSSHKLAAVRSAIEEDMDTCLVDECETSILNGVLKDISKKLNPRTEGAM